MAAMRDFGAPIQAHGVTVEDFTVEDNVYQIGVAPNRIDLLTSITGVTFDDAWASRVGVHVAGMDFFVLGRGALIANKRALGRPKDLVDALALEAAEPR